MSMVRVRARTRVRARARVRVKFIPQMGVYARASIFKWVLSLFECFKDGSTRVKTGLRVLSRVYAC